MEWMETVVILAAPDILCEDWIQSKHPGSTMTESNIRFTISPHVIFQEVFEGDSILLDVSTVRYFAFDPLGTQIWQAMQKADNADEVIEMVAMKSDVPTDDLRLKFRGILSGLARSGLITIVPQQ